jgi:hypothetical protein
MRIEFLEGKQTTRALGGAVVRSDVNNVIVEFGSADGPPSMRLRLSSGEAVQLSQALKAVANGRAEEIILAEE